MPKILSRSRDKKLKHIRVKTPIINNAHLEQLLLSNPIDEEKLIEVTRPMIVGIIAHHGWVDWHEDLTQIGAIKVIEIARARSFDPRRGKAYSLLSNSLFNTMLNWIKKERRVQILEHESISGLIEGESEQIMNPPAVGEVKRIIASMKLSKSEHEMVDMILTEPKDRPIAKALASQHDISFIDMLRRVQLMRLKVRLLVLDYMSMPDRGRFSKDYLRWSAGKLIEFLADLFSPTLLYKFLRLYGGYTIYVPSISDLINKKVLPRPLPERWVDKVPAKNVTGMKKGKVDGSGSKRKK